MPAITHYTNEPQKVLPSANFGVSVTPNSVSLNNSVWVELSSGIANDIVLVGVIVNPDFLNVTLNVDVGKGAAASEVVAGTILAYLKSTVCFYSMLYFRIPIIVTANNRLSVRMRKLGTDVNVWTYKLVYYTLPAGGGTTITGLGQKHQGFIYARPYL